VDDFGDVFGFYYLVTGDGYNPRELRAYAKELQTELLQVPGVAKISLDGEQKEAIFVEVTRQAANTLGVSLQSIYNILDQQNAVVPAGEVTIGELAITVSPRLPWVYQQSLAAMSLRSGKLSPRSYLNR
jgi:multidrug efflux pump subunit AcrB